MARALEAVEGSRPSRRYWVFGGLSALLLLVVVLLASRTKTGTLVVTIADSSGAPLASAEVRVDGTRRCRSSPCKLEDLKRGAHRVQVSASGYQDSPEQKVEVESGGKTLLPVTLLTEPPKPPSPEPVARAEAQEPTDTEAPEEADKPAKRGQQKPGPGREGSAKSAGQAAPEAAADKDTSHASDAPGANTNPYGAGKGSLTVTSDPSGTVYLDGRPSARPRDRPISTRAPTPSRWRIPTSGNRP